MNLQQEILKEYSKANVDSIANYVGGDEQRFAELMQLFLNGDYITTQRSSWILSECAANQPSLVYPFFKEFIEKLHAPNVHDSARRNIIRTWQFIEIPEEYIGEVYDTCFRFLSSNEAIAVIVFSMTVCHNITKIIPELKQELFFMIENVVQKHQYGSPAIKSRGNKILAELKKK
ncbi:hypothetical protein [Emticicia sp. SJ17W-69]|uniref:hypothetical protein n=1 Tax=Emticicia sp. SJ17W-69 TaxID=3421657 RepID=UPI003EB6E2CC